MLIKRNLKKVVSALAIVALLTPMFYAIAQTKEPVVEEIKQEVVVEVVVETPVVVKEIPKKFVFDNVVLKAICTCESDIFGKGEPQHYEKDGVTVITGRVDRRDTGMCQINKGYHQKTADKLGLNLNTPQGNWDYAKYLYRTQGTQPWSASKPCWSKLI